MSAEVKRLEISLFAQKYVSNNAPVKRTICLISIANGGVYYLATVGH